MKSESCHWYHIVTAGKNRLEDKLYHSQRLITRGDIPYLARADKLTMHTHSCLKAIWQHHTIRSDADSTDLVCAHETFCGLSNVSDWKYPHMFIPSKTCTKIRKSKLRCLPLLASVFIWLLSPCPTMFVKQTKPPYSPQTVAIGLLGCRTQIFLPTSTNIPPDIFVITWSVSCSLRNPCHIL